MPPPLSPLQALTRAYHGAIYLKEHPTSAIPLACTDTDSRSIALHILIINVLEPCSHVLNSTKCCRYLGLYIRHPCPKGIQVERNVLFLGLI